MELKEVVKEFQTEIVKKIKGTVKNDGYLNPNVSFLVSDEEGNCEVVLKQLPPTPIDTLDEPNLNGMIKIMFHKFIFEMYTKEIQNDKKDILSFIQSESLYINNKKTLSIVFGQVGKKNPINKLYEIVEENMIVLDNGDMKPSSVQLIEIEND